MSLALRGRALPLACLLAACGGEEVPRPAGTVLAEVSEFTYGENDMVLLDESESATAEVRLGARDPVAVTIEMTLGVARVSFPSDGSHARHRVLRRLVVRLPEATARMRRASCESTLNGPVADPPATLFTRCSFSVGDGDAQTYSVDVFGDGQVRPSAPSEAAAIAIAPGGAPLRPLPGDPPGTVSQFLVAEEEGRFNVVEERPQGPFIELAPPTVSRTQLTITLSEGRAQALLARLRPDGRTALEESETRSVDIEGPLEASALEPLFEGHGDWPTPVAAILEVPASAPHRDVMTLIDALRAHGIERMRLAVR